MRRLAEWVRSWVVVGVVVTSSATAGAAPQLLKGPYLTGLSDAHVDVRLELDAPATVSVDLLGEGADAGAKARTVEDPPAAMHVVRVGNLLPGKAYTYAVRSGGAAIGAGSFTTAPSPTSSAPTTFLVYGDDRSDETTHAAIVRQLTGTPADFLVNTGDIVADGGRAADWQSFFQVEGPLLKDRAFFLSIGNHELYDDEAGGNFARYFGFLDDHGSVAPYGTVRWGALRFFFLNGMHDWARGEERQWLERELTSADDEVGLVWRIAVVHHGPWSSGPHGGNAKLLSARVPELLEQHHVDLVLSGHDHIYERGQVGPTKYLVSGGGGAPLYPIQQRLSSTRKAESAYHFIEVTAGPEAMRIVARTVDGRLIESCAFQKARAWDCDAPAETPVAGAPAPSPSPDASPSKCGCRVPGTSTPGVPALATVLGVLGLTWVLRRGRGRRP